MVPYLFDNSVDILSENIVNYSFDQFAGLAAFDSLPFPATPDSEPIQTVEGVRERPRSPFRPRSARGPEEKNDGPIPDPESPLATSIVICLPPHTFSSSVKPRPGPGSPGGRSHHHAPADRERTEGVRTGQAPLHPVLAVPPGFIPWPPGDPVLMLAGHPAAPEGLW